MRFAVWLLLVVGCSDARPAMPKQHEPTRPRIIAHRGASHDAPENTLAAFHRAWQLGVEGVELDVRVTSDGQVVVIHDDNTKRVTGVDKLVAAQTLAEIQALDAGRGERIPTLAQAMATIPPGHSMFIEIKTGVSTVPAVAQAITSGRPSNATILLQSFDAEALAALAAAVPDAAAYWTVDPPVDATGAPLPYPHDLIDQAVRRKFAGVALMAASVDGEFLAAARSAGILVDVWTINDPADLTTWGGREVRWIETDRPDLAAAQP